MGIYSKIFKKGIGVVKNFTDKKSQPIQKNYQPQKKNYTPVIIGAIGILIITGIYLTNKKK